MMQGISGGSVGGANKQSNPLRNPMEVHQESMIGRSIVQLFNQVNDLETALGTLHDRMAPVMVPPSSAIATGSGTTEVQLNSPMSSDMLILQSKVSQAADRVYDLIHRLSI